MRGLRRLFQYSRDWRDRYVIATIYAVLNKLFDIAPEVLIGVAVDVVVKREESFLAAVGIEDLRLQLMVLGILTVLIWGGESLFQYLYELAWRNLAQAFQHKVRSEVYDHVQHLKMSELGSRRQGELQTILTEDVNQLERFLNTGFVAIIHVVTSTLAVSVIFLILSPSVALFAMLPIPIIILLAFAFQRGLSERYGRVRESAGLLGARLTAQLHGISTIKSYTAQTRALDALEFDSQSYEATNRRAIRLASAFVPTIRMAILTGFVVTLVYGGFQTLDGTLSIGAYSILVFLTQRLLWPFTRLGETVDLYQRSMASLHRLLDVLELERETSNQGRVIPSDAFSRDIELKDVSFAYDPEIRVLQNLSLRFGGDQTTGIVGSTGSGKSTLTKLLLRLYAPTDGSITMGGHPLEQIELEQLRREVGWVSQDVFLFHGTVHDNIALGRPDATRAEVVEAARWAELDEFISGLPGGYDTSIGDFGSTLSGGQRQRLAIARAVLKDPKVLILDEATSAVDSETEAAIQRSLARIAQGRTVIVVAHRLSTIRDADHIFVLEGGRLVEEGTHASLLAEGTRYQRLWSVQTGQITGDQRLDDSAQAQRAL